MEGNKEHCEHNFLKKLIRKNTLQVQNFTKLMYKIIKHYQKLHYSTIFWNLQTIFSKVCKCAVFNQAIFMEEN